MIVPMKKVTLYALKEDREALLVALQQCGKLMISSTEDSLPQEGCEESRQALRRIEENLGYTLREGGAIKGARQEVGLQSLFEEDAGGLQLMEELEQVKAQIASSEGQIDSLRTAEEQLAPWLPLDTPLGELRKNRTVDVLFGFCPTAALEGLRALCEEAGGALESYGEGKEGTAAALCAKKGESEALFAEARERGFTESDPPRLAGTAAEEAEGLAKRRAALEAEAQAAKDRLKELIARREELAVLRDKQAVEAERLAVENTETVSTFCLHGWVCAGDAGKVKATIESVTDAFDLAIEEPGEEEKPPTLERNKRLIRPFETITDMFSYPDPRELDPNPMMGPWYWFIFGMMMGDVGYGLMLALGAFAILKIKKPDPSTDFSKLLRVFMMCSLSTAFWGVMFGSYFGESLYPALLFVPLDEPMATLIVCMIIGALHIFSGMFLNLMNKARGGDVLGGILDNVPWMFLLTGLGLMLGGIGGSVGMYLAIAGAAVVLLTAGRDRPGVFKKVVGGLSGLYGVINYASDILSYARILALVLSGGVVAMVMNMLAGMLQGGIGWVFAIVVYIIGHVFNVVMSLLSAYVHASRLQYIEFFGKFYEGNGYAFRPLSVKPKYVEVKK